MPKKDEVAIALTLPVAEVLFTRTVFAPIVGNSASVSELFAKFNVPNAFNTPEIVVEPVTASAVVVAPFAVRPPLNAICVVVAFDGKR